MRAVFGRVRVLEFHQTVVTVVDSRAVQLIHGPDQFRVRLVVACSVALQDQLTLQDDGESIPTITYLPRAINDAGDSFRRVGSWPKSFLTGEMLESDKD